MNAARRSGVTLVEAVLGLVLGVLVLGLLYALLFRVSRSGERMEVQDREALARMIVGQALRWDLVQARAVEWDAGGGKLTIQHGEESHVYEAREGALLRDGRALTLPAACRITLGAPAASGLPVEILFGDGTKVDMAFAVPAAPRSRARWLSLAR